MLKYPKLNELWKDEIIKNEICELIFHFGQGDCYGVACGKYCDSRYCVEAQEKAINEMLEEEVNNGNN